MPTLIKTVDGRDIIYTSNTGYTVSVGRYQVTPHPGVRLRDIDPQLEELTRDTEVSIATFAQDPTTGAVTGLVGPSGSDFLVVSSSAPNNADGRPDGTIYFHIQP